MILIADETKLKRDFPIFVIRHVYYDEWAKAIRKGTVNLDYKKYCESLPENVWTESERSQLFIS